MSIVEILQSKPDAELAIAVQEVVSWRKTSVLEGSVLRTITHECGDGFDLRNVESELLLLAASRWADSVTR